MEHWYHWTMKRRVTVQPDIHYASIASTNWPQWLSTEHTILSKYADIIESNDQWSMKLWIIKYSINKRIVFLDICDGLMVVACERCVVHDEDVIQWQLYLDADLKAFEWAALYTIFISLQSCVTPILRHHSHIHYPSMPKIRDSKSTPNIFKVTTDWTDSQW